VFVAFAPGSRKRVLLRRESRRPLPLPQPGDVLSVRRTRLRVTSFETRIERRSPDVIEHTTLIYTRAMPKKRSRRIETAATNVVRMPTGDSSTVAEFLRYHVLVRVFDGDPDAWLAHLRDRGGSEGDVRFVRRVRSQLRKDPALLGAIRKMVDATPFWRVAEA
jgi:hypothetical protein